MADMQRFTADPQQLGETVKRLAAFDAAAEEVLRAVDQRIAALHLSWTGPAAEAQKSSHDRWVRGIGEMREGLKKLREGAGNAEKNYSDAVNANKKMWP